MCFSRKKENNRQILKNVFQESYKHKRLCVGKLIFDDLDDGQDAPADLFRSVTVVVRAYPQHDNLQHQQNKKGNDFRILWII